MGTPVSELSPELIKELKCVYFAALDGNKIVGNGEIVGGKLRQFRGFANGPVPNNDFYMQKLMEIGVQQFDVPF